MNVNDTVHYISTVIVTETSYGSFQGTGFYYKRLADMVGEGPQYRRVNEMWLVTNRHVLLPRTSGVELIPSNLTFNLRKTTESGSLVWDPITLLTDDIGRLSRFHPDKSIDIAVVDILELVTDRLDAGVNIKPPYGLSFEHLPSDKSIDIEVTSDIIVVGYPRGFYDTVNLFPIVKAGIIASRWGVGFKGEPYFLIDAKLFPGSSGSVVLTKPNDIMVKNGEIMYAKEKQFVLLGVFSGEPGIEEAPVEIGELTITRKSDFNLGIVWYAQLIEDVVKNGVTLNQTLST